MLFELCLHGPYIAPKMTLLMLPIYLYIFSTIYSLLDLSESPALPTMYG